MAQANAPQRLVMLPASYLCVVWLAACLMLAMAGAAQVQSPLAAAFFAAAAVTYPALYLSPLLGVVLIGRLVGRWTRPAVGTGLGAVLIVLWTSAVLAGLWLDQVLLRMYGFHLNGFVWNLVITPGGLESLGADRASWLGASTMLLGGVASNGALLWWLRRRARKQASAWSWRRWLGVGLAVLALMTAERFTYGLSHFTGRSDVLAAAGAVPLYQPTTFRHLAQALGFTPQRGARLRLARGGLRYPLAALHMTPPARPPNLIWLVAESLRADALSPQIMPATTRFAEQAVRFTQHYSAGNGTRMGIFGMFYGLWGPYWFPVLEQRRAPVLMDALRRLNYRIEAWTSASFSYPEFDQTVFAGLPRSALHDAGTGPGWERDRAHVGELLRYVDRARQAPDGRPFMAFMFFESPHARYYFPPENAIRQPYLEDFNYATVNLARDIELIRNRYLNACNHLDSQFARVFEHLRQGGLLENTIVIITGDHGEEFMEKGRWGHNSTFVQEQVRVPLVIAMPGMAPGRVTRMTSHLDLPATVLARLGAANAPSELSLGHDLFGPHVRQAAVLADWSSVAWVGQDYKAVYPLKGTGMLDGGTSTPEDAPVPDPGAVRAAHSADLAILLEGLSRFRHTRP